MPIWTVGNTPARTQPTDGEQFSGFSPNQRPSAYWHNWLWGVMSDWLAWFDYVIQTGQSPMSVATPTGVYVAANPVTKIIANPAGGAFNITLPSAALNLGYQLTIKNVFGGSNNVTVLPSGSDLLEGQSSIVLAPGDAITLCSDGVNKYHSFNP